jgi:hypothetical protein
MPSFYAEILRSVIFRDNNFRPLSSNDPSTSTTSLSNHGLGLSTNGDILAVSGGGSGKWANENVYGGLNISSSNWPYIVFRAKGSGVFNFSLSRLGFPVAGPFSTTVTGQWTTYTVKLGSGISYDAIAIGTGSPGDNIALDYIANCKLPPVQISQTDLISGTVTRTSMGADHAELRLNNHRGKYVVGSSSSTAPGFGDHLHIYMAQPGLASGILYGPPLHVYGGYVEYQEPIQPNDEIMINSRGFGVALQEMLVANQPSSAPIYTNESIQTIINDFIDNNVNNANKNSISGIPNYYQITRSYVQSIGTSIPLYVTQFKSAWDSMKELADLAVGLFGYTGVFFVDPAENLHFVPLGGQGSANWTSDPIAANYATSLAYGSNLVTYRFRRDVQSLRNRVHYYGVSQTPGKYGAWTEQTASSWGSERLGGGSTATFSDDNTVVATGGWSVKCVLADAGSAANSGAMFYPAAKNLGLDISHLGSVYSPPLFDFYIRLNNSGNANTIADNGFNVFFATDASNRFEYNFVADGVTSPLQAILGIQGLGSVTSNYWYHVLLPIGPNGGVLFNSTPIVNTVAPTIYTGASQYQRTNVGTPSWSNINYIGFYYNDTGGGEEPSASVPFWFNGWRIIGGRYIIAYDNRSPPGYPDVREIHYYDPVSKDATALQAYATAELKRLRNPIVRGTVTCPLLADMYPEQQVQITTPSANYSNTYLRASTLVHRFSSQGMLTEVQLSDDFTNSQMLDQWKLTNALSQMGENAILSREVYDLKTAILDPTFTPQLVPVT